MLSELFTPEYLVQDIIFLIAIAATIVIYIARFISIVRGQHQPSLATWLMYFLNAALSALFAWQTSSGLLFTLSLSITAALIFILIILTIWSSLKYGHKNWHYTKFDLCIAVISGAIILAYYLGISVYISAVALWLATRLSELPTTRKVYHAPFTEIVWVDVVGALRSFLLFFTLEEVNPVGIVNTIGSGAVMLVIAGWCLYNQKRLSSKKRKNPRRA